MSLRERWMKTEKNPDPVEDHFVRPEPTDRLIDMRRRYWGHNLALMDLHEDGPPGAEMWGTVLGWCTPVPKVGDLMIWDVSKVIITKVKPMYDPPDMFKVWFLMHEAP